MLSAAILSSTRVASMMSPVKNPCRIRVSAVCSPSTAASLPSWYRYDPYVSKVLPSPMKTPLSPSNEDQAIRVNSLFNQQPEKPRSFLAAVSEAPRPTSQKAESAKIHYAVVSFKHDSATFIAPFRIAAGDHVIVEGDRGEDLGCVTEITTETPAYPVPLKILRRAAPRDMERYREKKLKEEQTVCSVQKLAAQLNLGIEVVDTEFQYDGNKLTVYFNAGNGHTDFRKLQRGLFRDHRCRIWLSNMAEVQYNANLQKIRRTR